MDCNKIWKKEQNVQKNRKWWQFLCIIWGLRPWYRKTVNTANQLITGKVGSKMYWIQKWQIKIILSRARSSWVLTWSLRSLRVHSVPNQQYDFLFKTVRIVTCTCKTFTSLAYFLTWWIVLALTQSVHGKMFHIFYCHYRYDDGSRCHGMYDACGKAALGWVDGEILSRWRKSLETLKNLRFLMSTFMKLINFYFYYHFLIDILYFWIFISLIPEFIIIFDTIRNEPQQKMRQ